VSEQAGWYRKAATEWNIKTFEVPIFPGHVLPPELVEVFSEVGASIVGTMVANWAARGQADPAYGLSSTVESARRHALLDAQSVLQQCLDLSARGVGVRAVAVHTGQRTGGTIEHGIALHRSLSELALAAQTALPQGELTLEVADSLPADHAIPFPAAKKAALDVDALIQVLAAVNDEGREARTSVSLMLNWGRMLINGDRPLDVIDKVLSAGTRLCGVILSGAGASPDGFMDSHNSHLDPESGFTLDDARQCAAVLRASSPSSFLGTKCSVKKGDGEVSVEEVLAAQVEVLNI
jgi:hypothetical protein